MPSPILGETERMIGYLSRREQLWLIEELAHRLRQGPVKDHAPGQGRIGPLAMMADDPEIQAELQKINQEFAATEAV